MIHLAVATSGSLSFETLDCSLLIIGFGFKPERSSIDPNAL